MKKRTEIILSILIILATVIIMALASCQTYTEIPDEIIYQSGGVWVIDDTCYLDTFQIK